MTTTCAGCCDDTDCPCIKACDEERWCEVHHAEQVAAARAEYGRPPATSLCEDCGDALDDELRCGRCSREAALEAAEMLRDTYDRP